MGQVDPGSAYGRLSFMLSASLLDNHDTTVKQVCPMSSGNRRQMFYKPTTQEWSYQYKLSVDANCTAQLSRYRLRREIIAISTV